MLLIILFMVISGLTTLLVMKNNKLQAIKSQKIELNERKKALDESEVSIKKEIERLEDPEYVANLARRDYYLSKKDEYIFRKN